MQEVIYCKECGLAVFGRQKNAIYHKECARLIMKKKANERERRQRQKLKQLKQKEVMVVEQ